ncbi:MAG TPA: (2Fe-2S)-binding protein [Spirochaetia bacterium]|nr:(2Fe-2S)-binding protein [Spirochaetales bacterium]HRZ87948.1 (2Fe-2S)-binding protein [Spirochaetia bacterium]
MNEATPANAAAGNPPAAGTSAAGLAGALTVNGIRRQVRQEEAELTLLEYLREVLGLTGTKNGCAVGACGSCTVVVNGQGRRSCKTRVSEVLGKDVVTIEGLEGRDGSLHPIQQSFIDAGAIQCGFCTPGMVMSAYALLLRDPSPDRTAIRTALSGNLCRCTGYQQIVDAVELAAARMRG